MVVEFKSELLGCNIDSTMTKVKLDSIAKSIYLKILKFFNHKFKLNATSFDETLSFLDGADYTLATMYINQYNFLFNTFHNDSLNLFTFYGIIEQATSYNIEILIND